MPDSLRVRLHNDSDSSNLHVYITGIAIQQGGRRCLVKADGTGLYFPSDVTAIGSSLAEDCAIPLGPPGQSVDITIPQIAGGRIWVADGLLTFLLNPTGGDSAALVEPSVLNPSDPNAKVDFGFAEFTLNDGQLYANISYVDFIPRIPVALRLDTAHGESQFVAGMRPDGIDQVAGGLREQSGKDGRPWDKLIVNSDRGVLRILNATHGDAVSASFSGYYEPYVTQVWEAYGTKSFSVNTQAGPGVLSARIDNGKLCVGGESFDQPSTADIFGCNSGPFTTGPSATRNAIIPRLAAAFVRSSLLNSTEQPSQPDTFYRTDPTNHYARLVHQHNVDGKGYAFAYDDVQPDGGEDQSGKVNAGDPTLFTLSFGGKSA